MTVRFNVQIMFRPFQLTKFLAALVVTLSGVAAMPTTARSQTSNIPTPRESRLLNGARLLVWYDAKAPNVSVTIRIHSGSAFDPLGKEGAMQLMSDLLFPTETTRSFFEEDLNGSFEIVTTYDYIQINTSGDSDKFLSILETLAPAISNPVINKETTERVKAPHLEKLAALEKDPEYVARRAAIKNLFGNYPYGRPQLGTPESVAKIDFADLLNAEQRFFTADNATIAIHGNVTPEFALRASKRLLGGWLKSDKKVPATFAAPNPPDTSETRIALESSASGTGVLAWRTGARNGRDYWASVVTEAIWKEKYCMSETQSHLLDGLGMIVKRLPASDEDIVRMMRSLCPLYLSDTEGKTLAPEISAADFNAAKEMLQTRMKETVKGPKSLVNAALDVETFKLVSIADEQKRLAAVTLDDVKRINSAWLAKAPVRVFVTPTVAK